MRSVAVELTIYSFTCTEASLCDINAIVTLLLYSQQSKGS